MNFAVHRKEKKYFAVMAIIGCIAYAFALCALFFAWGVLKTVLIYIAGMKAINFLLGLGYVGYMKGNGIQLTEKQFPEIYKIFKKQVEQLGLKNIPTVYLMQGHGALNAFASRFAGKNFIVINSGILETAYQEGPDEVAFVIGHELGHIARDHISPLKSFLISPARMIPFLGLAYSRACEYTCDNIGFSLSPNGAATGLLILASGSHLYKRIDIEELLLKAANAQGFATGFAEIFSTHPHLITRIKEMDLLQKTHVNKELFNIEKSAVVTLQRSTFDEQRPS